MSDENDLTYGDVLAMWDEGEPVELPPPEDAWRHRERFRRVANRYSRWAVEAYDRDLERAMADTDEQVAATVAAWEPANGPGPVDWAAIGRAEGRDRES